MSLTKIIDGLYKVEFNNFDIFQLEDAARLQDEASVRSITTFLALELGFNLSEIYWWNSFIIGGNIEEPPHLWHYDRMKKDKSCDTLLLIYFVDEKLTEETGGRIGFCDADGKNKQYYNIVSGSCFLANQYKTLHSAEIIKKQLTKRMCISCGLTGWDNFSKVIC